MTTVASTLLDFILGLFGDEEAAKAFEEDPEAALAAAGFPDVDPATVHALMPVMADSSPAAHGRYGGHRDDDHDDHDDKGHGGHHGGHKPVKDEDCDKDDGHWHKVWHDDDHCDDDAKDDCADDDHGGHGGHDKDHGGHRGHDYAGHGQEAAVIHNVRYVENNYSHTDVDVDVDIENAIWAGAGSQVVTGDDNVVAGAGGVAAGDDIEDSTVHTGDSDDDTLNVNSGNSINSGNVIGNEDNDTLNIGSNNQDNDTLNIGSHNQDNDGTEVNQVGLVNTVGDGNFDASDDDGIDQDGLVNVVDNDGVDQDGLVNANGDGNFDASDDDGQDVDQHGLVNGNAGGDLDASDDDGIDQDGLVNVGDDVDASDDDVLSNNDVLSHNDVLSNNEDNDVNDQDGSGNVFDPDLIDVDVPVTVEAEPAA